MKKAIHCNHRIYITIDEIVDKFNIKDEIISVHLQKGVLNRRRLVLEYENETKVDQ